MQMVQCDCVDYSSPAPWEELYALLSGVRWFRDEEAYKVCYARNNEMQRCRYPLGLGSLTMWKVHLLPGQQCLLKLAVGIMSSILNPLVFPCQQDRSFSQPSVSSI
jgi:hypothetical protein